MSSTRRDCRASWMPRPLAWTSSRAAASCPAGWHKSRTFSRTAIFLQQPKVMNAHLRPNIIGVAAVAGVLLLDVACGGRTAVKTTASDPTAVDVSQLWQEPADLESRNLFAGPSVAGVTVPEATTSFTFVKADRTGY